MNVLNLTQTLPNPNPCGAAVPQFGHTILCSSRLNFLSLSSGVILLDIFLGRLMFDDACLAKDRQDHERLNQSVITNIVYGEVFR